MQLPIRVNPELQLSLQEQISCQIRKLILGGNLKPSMRLPASRQLAEDLKVSRNTILGAYSRLIAEGLIVSYEPVGTFVVDKVPRDSPVKQMGINPSRSLRSRVELKLRGKSYAVVSPRNDELQFDFWVGRPDYRFFPSQAWRVLLNRVLRDYTPEGLCNYGDPQGLYALREAIAGHISSSRGILSDARHILITNGIQEGLNILARLFIRSGVSVAVENPCYRGAAKVFDSFGATLHPIPLDSKGINTSRLPESASLIYVTPSHQYPLGMTLSIQRREQLLAWSGDTGCYIIEDDYDNDFFYNGAPLPAIKSQDYNDQVIYLGTFSKSLGAGLRIGYMVLPDDLCVPAVQAKARLNSCQSWLPQAALAEFITSGSYAGHLRRIRKLYAKRCEHLRVGLKKLFPKWEVQGIGGGMHLVVKLPDRGPDGSMIQALAYAHGIGVYAAVNGNAQSWNESTNEALSHTLLLGYAAHNEAEITTALLRLQSALYVNSTNLS